MLRFVIPSLVLLVIWCGRLIAADYNFDVYPVCAQSVLSASAPTDCDYGDITFEELQMTNQCLCSDTNFLTAAFKQIGSSCGCDDVTLSASTAIMDCDLTDTPAAESQQQLIAAGGCSAARAASSSVPAVQVTTTKSAGHVVIVTETPATGTTTSGSTSTNNDSPKSDDIALGVGIGIGVPTLLLGVLGLWWQCVKRK